MAKTSKKDNGSLIVMWVLIVLLAVGTIFVVANYKDNNSDLISNEEVGQALSDAFDKPIGRITAEDLASIEGVLYYEDLPFSITGTDVQAMSAIEFYLEGYEEAFDAYNAEGLTEEQKAELVAPETLAGYVQLTSKDNVFEDLKLLTGIKSFLVYNYGETDSETDMLKFAADNYTELEELTVFGYTTEDFGVVSKLTGLTSLSVVDETVSDISAVKDLTKLEVLSLNGTELTDLSPIAGLTSLKNLSVSGTSVADISPVAGLTNLEQLDLSDNKITDIAPLASLDNEKLEVLYITGNEITDFAPISHIDEDKVTKDEPEEEEVTDEVTEDVTDEEASDDASTDESNEEITEE